MKIKLTYILFLLFCGCLTYGQEEFKKHYVIPSSPIGIYTLKKETTKKYDQLTEQEKKELTNGYTIGEEITILQTLIIDGKETTVHKTVTVDDAFFATLSKKEITNANLNYKAQAMVASSKDKLIVNPYLVCGESSTIYFYQLENRKSIKLWTKSLTVNAMTIPLKYRFKGKNGLGEEFSTGINGNMFVGYSFGKTNFMYLKEVGTKENAWSITSGFLFGVSSVKLNKTNTDLSSEAITDASEITKGLGSVAFGITGSYNKINGGVFIGADYAFGQKAYIWNHNKKPWLGIGFGYKIF